MYKTLDFFTYNGEEDILELRLSMLDEYVDFFILTESVETFSGKPKPLYYQENKERFAKWNRKIIPVIVGTFETDNPFERAFFQKDYAWEYIKDDDKVYFSDVDEIWTPFDGFGRLHQIQYCYYLNQRSSEDWYGTITGTGKELRGKFNELRASAPRIEEYHGYHFTNMGGYEKLVKKLESYDHQEFNCQEIKEELSTRLASGKDYIGRNFNMWIDENQWPEYLKINRQKYKHLLK